MKGKTHDLNHDDLTFSAYTINCVCHSIRSMFGVLGIYNFELKGLSLRCIKIDTNVQLCYNEIEDFLFIRNAYLFGKQISGLELFHIFFRNLSEN